MSLLSISGLAVEIGNKQIFDNVNLEVGVGEVVAITGPNGGGKSSLVNVLLGNTQYKVCGGTVRLGERDLLSTPADERARGGMYVAWQNPVSIPGVSVFALCKSAYEAVRGKVSSVVEFKKELESLALRVGLTKEHVARNVNDGFSGGEKKRLELLQLILLKPKMAIIDEIDSGMDKAGQELFAEIVGELSQHGTAFVVVTHSEKILDLINAQQVWIMKNGQLQARV